MRNSTDSYNRFKGDLDDIWNFALMISYAVPSLSKTIKGTEEKIKDYSIPNPDFFKYDNSTNEQLKSYMKGYKTRLSMYLWISIFSFFEAYFNSVLAEFIKFHGGKDELLAISKDNNLKQMNKITDDHLKTVKLGKLHLEYDSSRVTKNVEHTQELINSDFTFPSEFFSAFGVKNFINQSNKVNAKDIPIIMSDCFNFELKDDFKIKYDTCKNIRNEIAHGKTKNLSLKDVKDLYFLLKNIATLFDTHLLKYYFINERFRQYLEIN